jgi:hypothetical protein
MYRRVTRPTESLRRPNVRRSASWLLVAAKLAAVAAEHNLA